MNKQQELKVDLKNTTSVTGFDEGHLFGQAFLLRKVSKFVVGGNEDGLLPIPVFYDLDTRKIIKDSIPTELREEYEDITL
tara:strand:+ start:355 stop:594 length:240 start_codon:yes stop_codon:yes gene_type:complete